MISYAPPKEKTGFTRTNLDCRCGQHKKCYAVREDESAYCFSCGQNFPTDKPRYQTLAWQGARKPDTYRAATAKAAVQEPKAIPYAETIESMRDVAQNRSHFCRLMHEITGQNPAWHYGVGAFGNDVVFWYRDYKRIVRNAKRMTIMPNGFNRDKTGGARFLYKAEHGYSIPFFGEEFLPECVERDDVHRVVIVESEKSVLYAQYVFEKYLWLGASGSNGCTTAKIERVAHLLSKKRVFVLFDNDDGGVKGTESALRNFKRCGIEATALRLRDLIADAPEHFDIADAIVSAKGVVL
jgi:hypothetical protein